MGGPTQKRNFFSDVYSFTWGSMSCIYFLCLVMPLLPVVYILYKTDSLFSASAVRRRRGRVVGLHNPCFGRMAVERCLRYFVIRACSRDVWEKFSLGTSLNKQCLSAYNNDKRVVV